MVVRFRREGELGFSSAQETTRAAAGPLLELLSAGFEITEFGETSEGQWWALAQPDGRLFDLFGLRREAFVVGVGPSVDFDPKVLSQQPSAVLAPRCDPGVRFLACRDARADVVASSWSTGTGVNVVVLKTGLAPNSDGFTTLTAAIGASLWKRDLFDQPEPVGTPSDFFGRHDELAKLNAAVRSGASVAVAGLRKTGKSSFLLRARDDWDADGATVTLTALLSGGSARLRHGRWWAAAQQLLEAWLTSFSARAKALGSKVQASAGELAGLVAKRVVDPGRLRAAFEKDVSALSKAARALAKSAGGEGARLVLCFDDCDEILPHTADAGTWREDFFVLWNLLDAVRGRLDSPADFVSVLASTNPSGFEQGLPCRSRGSELEA